MPAILPVVSNLAVSEHGSPPGNETTGSNNGARSEGGVTNDTSGPNKTWTQPSANSDQSSKQTSFGTVLSASVAAEPKTKAKSSGASTPDTASPAIPDVVSAIAAALPAVVAPVNPASADVKPANADMASAPPVQIASVQAGNVQTFPSGQEVGVNPASPSNSPQADTPNTANASFSQAIANLPTSPEAITATPMAVPSPPATANTVSGADAAATNQIKNLAVLPKQTANGQPSSAADRATSINYAPVTAIHRESSGESNSGSTGSNSQGDSSSQQSSTSALTTQTAVNATSVAAQAAVASSSVAERVSVINQITQQLAASPSASAPSGTQSVTVHVSPPHWGDMSINLTSQTTDGKSGPITATITTESTAARDALASHASDLKSSLSASGIKLDKLEITTSDKAGGNQLTFSADKASAASNAQGSGMQSNTGGQQFSNSQHNASNPHLGQGTSSAMADQNRGGHGQHTGFASMLNGDGQSGRGGSNGSSPTQLNDIDPADDAISVISSFGSGTSGRAGINVLA